MNCACSDTPSPSKTMGLNSPLATLWNGLKKLESQHQEKKEKLLALLRVKKAISKEDQNWLDGAANLVDEVCILEALEKAPDYKTGLGKLSPSDWMVVEALKKLRDWEQSVQVERKWKCECHISHCMLAEKRSDTPLMTTNPGLESSKVPGIMKGKGAWRRSQVESTRSKSRSKPLSNRELKSSTGTTKMGKNKHLQLSTLTKSILSFVSNSPWYVPGSKMKQNGMQDMQQKMVWLTLLNEPAKHVTLRLLKWWIYGL